LFKGFTWGLVVGFLGGMLLIGGLVVGYAWLTGQIG
jgi:hypothetical protein